MGGTLRASAAERLAEAVARLRLCSFGLAQTLREQSGSRALTGHGTLYKALSRLEEFGLLTSDWEDAAAAEGRPRRRLYELTGKGARVAEQALAGSADQAPRRRLRIASEPA